MCCSKIPSASSSQQRHGNATRTTSTQHVEPAVGVCVFGKGLCDVLVESVGICYEIGERGVKGISIHSYRYTILLSTQRARHFILWLYPLQKERLYPSSYQPAAPLSTGLVRRAPFLCFFMCATDPASNHYHHIPPLSYSITDIMRHTRTL